MCTVLGRELDLQWFRGPNLAPKFIKNRFKTRSETDRPLGWVLNGSWDGFWTIFGATWGPRWAPTWHQNGFSRSQQTVRKGCCYEIAIRVRLGVDFGSIVGGFGGRFGHDDFEGMICVHRLFKFCVAAQFLNVGFPKVRNIKNVVFAWKVIHFYRFRFVACQSQATSKS